MDDALRILLVEDNATEAVLLQESMSRVPRPPYVVHAETLERALGCLKEARLDAVLLDLALPDSEGLATLERICAAADHLPIVVLSGMEDEAFAGEAVRKGAQDYFIKGHASARQLLQTVYHAVERKRYERELAQSAQKNLLLAEVMAGVVAQTEVEDLLKTVAEAGRKLTSARVCCAGAGYIDGQFRVNSISHADFVGEERERGRCLNCGICLNLLASNGAEIASDQAVRGRTAWRKPDRTLSPESEYIGARLIDSRGRMTGSVIVGDKGDRESFTRDDDYGIRQLAAITSLALQHIESRRAAEAASVAKSRFLANMSHELRTPMNAILGMTDLALSENLSSTVRDYLQTARDSALSLLDLLNEILDLSRIEAGRFELESTPFSLRDTVEQVVKTLRVRAQEKGLGLVYHLHESIPDGLVGDPMRIRQVLINLVDNAIKFTHQGRIIVAASVRERSADSVTLEFSVSDTGIGIAPDDQDRIFSAFTQADTSTTRGYGGSGLGLTISRRLAGLMGGSLWVESLVDKGSTFFFTVRLKVFQEEVARTPRVERRVPAPVAHRSLRLLLAEDTPTNQKLAAYVLEKRGHFVEIAPDGQTAVERVRQNRYDVVLMDVQMPIMDGFQATAEIRALPDPATSGLPIIAMTAHTLQGDAERCLASGMDAYIGKPIQADALIELVEFLGEPGAVAVDLEAAKEQRRGMAEVPAIDGAMTDAEPWTPAAFDLQEAVDRCFGKYDFFLDMVEGFFSEVDELTRAMRDALQLGNMDKVRDAAHRLKNTVIYLGARESAGAITDVESAAKSARPSVLEPALAELEKRLDALKLALAEFRRPEQARTGASPDQRQDGGGRF